MENLLNSFWILAIAVNVLNALIVWLRVQPHIQKNPDLRPGYIKLICSFFLGMNLMWGVMGVGITVGGVSHMVDYFYPRSGNLFVVLWWVSIWAFILFLSDWIFFRDGAKTLIKYPGLLRGNSTNPKIIKSMWLFLLVGNAVGSAVIFSLEPR